MREWFGGYVLFALLLPCCSTANEVKSDLGSKVQRCERRGGGGDRKESELRHLRGLYGFGKAFWLWLWSGCDEPLVLPGVVPDGTLACPWMLLLLLWVGCCRSSPPKWTGVGICGGEEEDIFFCCVFAFVALVVVVVGVVSEDEDVGEG